MGKHSKFRRQAAFTAKQYKKAMRYFTPYLEFGAEALESIKGEIFNTETGPLWDYMYEKGTKLLRQQAAARGLVKSGPGMEAVTQYTEEMALQHINWKMGQWWNAANVGQWATSNVANLGVGMAESLQGLYQWGEQMKQQGYSQIGNMAMSGISSGMGMGMGMSGGSSGSSMSYPSTTSYYTPTTYTPTYQGGYATGYAAPSYYQ